MENILIHVTDLSNMERIKDEGLRAGSYLMSADQDSLIRYYEEEVELEGGTPVLLHIDLDELPKEHLVPDMPSIHEPITRAIEKSEEEVIEEWEASEKDWKASLAIVGSLKCMTSIHPDLIRTPPARSGPEVKF